MQHCDLANEHIIFYALDDLRGARREYVEAHIAGCPDCQRRLAEFQEVKRLLREAGSTADDAAHRAAIKQDIRQRARTRRRHGGWRALVAPKSKLSRWQPILLAGLLLVLIVAFLAPQTSLADFPLGRVIGILTEPASNGLRIISSSQDPPSAPANTPEPVQYDAAELPFQPVTPAALPFGLKFVDQTWPYPQNAASRYENASNLTIELIQTPIAASDLAISPNIETVTILNTVVMQHMSPEPGAIAALYWVRDGFVFQLSPLRAPYGGLMAEDAHLIARALMQAQDAIPRNDQGLEGEE